MIRKGPGLVLGLVVSVAGVACCSMGSVIGTLPNAEDDRGKIRDRASSGYLWTWHLYPKYLPNWSYKTQGVALTVGVEDWHSSNSIGPSGPDLSHHPFREIPEVTVIWIAIDAKAGAKMSLDPSRVRLAPPNHQRSLTPVCVAQGRTWKGGIKCDPTQSEIAKAAIQAYQSRWPSAPAISDPLTKIPVQGHFYAYLVFASPGIHGSDSTLEIEGVEAEGTALRIPMLNLKSFEYRTMMCPT